MMNQNIDTATPADPLLLKDKKQNLLGLHIAGLPLSPTKGP